MKSSTSNDLLDITPQKCSFSSSLGGVNGSCAFPSWPNRPSLLDSASTSTSTATTTTTASTSTTSTAPSSSSASARLSDDDLWPSELGALPDPPIEMDNGYISQGKKEAPAGDCGIVGDFDDDDDYIDELGNSSCSASIPVQRSVYMARLADAVEEEEARSRFRAMLDARAQSFEAMRGRTSAGHPFRPTVWVADSKRRKSKPILKKNHRTMSSSKTRG